MKKNCILALVTGTALMLSAGVPDIPLFKIFHKAADCDPAANILLSPLGIQECFGMISCGADKESAAEFSNHLGLTPAVSLEICKARKSLRQSKVDFSSFNAVFLNNKYQIDQNFADQVRKLYNGNIFNADYSRLETCVKHMNDMVKKESRGMFDNVFTPQMLADKPVLLLLNVLYFNGAWAESFDRNATQREIFINRFPQERKTTVDMMNDTRSVPYYNDGTVHGIILDYRDRRFKLLALAAIDRAKPLSAATELLAAKGLTHILRSSSRVNKTIIKLPKLKLSGELDLKSLLSSIGMTVIFDSRRNSLTGAVKGKPICISGAKQLVKLELDEEKTEAAAVTYAIAKSCAPAPGVPKYNHFHADRPFVLVLFDSKTNAVLLAAAIADPAKC